MAGRAIDSAYLIEDIPEHITKILQNKPVNSIEKAKRYEEDVASLSEYVILLRSNTIDLLGRLENLKTSEYYLNTLRKIQNILNEDISFPMPC